MLVENQLIEMVWSHRNKSHYVELGYKFTKHGEKFLVKAEDLSPSSTSEVKVQCDYCNKVISMSILQHNKTINNGEKNSCFACRHKKAEDLHGLNKKKQFYSIFLECCKRNMYIPITKLDEMTSHSIVEFICPIHGLQSLYYQNFRSGAMCKMCRLEINSNSKKLDVEEIKNVIASKNGNVLLNPEKYINARKSNLLIKCGSCGNIFKVSLTNYRRDAAGRCKKCSLKQSKGELIIEEFLKNRDIAYISEKRFENCKDLKTLPFDFYLPTYNTCIEFDGQQHFEPCYGEKSFKSTLKHDKIKNEFCKNNNIKLIRIPYWNGQYIEDILIDELRLNKKIKYINTQLNK